LINLKKWERAVISDIVLAVQVSPAVKRAVHTNRLSHGLVINAPGSEGRTYYFSDGRELVTRGGDLFYLPKGSSYRAEPHVRIGDNSCYAINFDANIQDEPFVMSFRNTEPVLRLFKSAEEEWKRQSPFCDVAIRKIIYELLLLIFREAQKKYVSPSTDELILPAVERIHSEFTKNDISVSELSSACGISEAYFRRIFLNKYGVSPKEYIIGLRMNFAKQLLLSGEFSISSVAELCGYSEPTHFSREFSRRVGMPPAKFKSGKQLNIQNETKENKR
jgi:AraC-like DNA-binding protein